MVEMFLCSLFTILPDYLYRRYVQGKRFGAQINLYTVWYELRWGITTCVMLTILLITLIFYYHPSTKNAIAFFRTVPLLPEGIGRVAEIYVDVRAPVKAGQKLFRIDDSEQKAAIETAKRKIEELDAQAEQDRIELAEADGKILEAASALKQAQDELAVQAHLEEREVVARRAVEKLQLVVDSRQGSLDVAKANKQSLQSQIDTLLPAQKKSAEAALAEAQVELDKTIVYAGVDGTVEQFTLRVGDIVNPLMRPAGVLVPADAGRRGLWAGFGQIEAQVMKVGMIGEVTCVAQPLSVIPMVVTEVQEMIAAGQIRPTDMLVDPLVATAPGTVTVFMEPLYQGGFDKIPPGGHCIANAYTSNHDRLADEDLGLVQWVYLHVIDTVGLVHAMILRVQALLLPVQTLVLGGH